MTNPERNQQYQGEQYQTNQGQSSAYQTASDVQQTTLGQGRQAIEQAADFQRSFAEIAMRSIESQQTAQRQAFEFTKSAIDGYVDTMNSMVPAVP
jgi:hypothetical protein